jgi:hypothetical protein
MKHKQMGFPKFTMTGKLIMVMQNRNRSSPAADTKQHADKPLQVYVLDGDVPGHYSDCFCYLPSFPVEPEHPV